jgi:hypothetical protein
VMATPRGKKLLEYCSQIPAPWYRIRNKRSRYHRLLKELIWYW